MSEPRPPDHGFAGRLAIVLAVGLGLRLLYVQAQVSTDPWFAEPQLDGATYVTWARGLAAGLGGPPGAFYLAPLYPWALALLFRVAGESFLSVYLVQQLLSVATAGGIAVAGRASAGPTGALFAAGLFLGYAPLQFFASRPLGETLALGLLVAALAIGMRARRDGLLAMAGFLVGAAALARPNLILVAAAWALVEAARTRWTRVLLLAAGVAVAVLPVTVRNALVSGHVVLVSSNAGLTLYHGNGPGARGIYQHPVGLPRGMGTVEDQRDAALAVARSRSGRDLDPVEADAWWGREAVRERIGHPLETLRLLGRRAALVLGDHEFGLDYPPLLDPNPWRPTLRLGAFAEIAVVPWALLVGLAAAGLVQSGARGTGGPWTWAAILACALTPLAFYVSSRYRLPVAALLALPAGRGLAGLVLGAPRRGIALALAAGLAVLSFAVPSAELAREERGGALANRSVAWIATGRLAEAEADARAAVRIAPSNGWLHYNLGVVLTRRNSVEKAEAAYREGLRNAPDLAEASAALGALLFGQGRFAEAVQVLRAAVVYETGTAGCWTNLVAALAASGDPSGARAAARDARVLGFEIPPELLRIIEGELSSPVDPHRGSP